MLLQSGYPKIKSSNLRYASTILHWKRTVAVEKWIQIIKGNLNTSPELGSAMDSKALAS